MHNHGVRFIDKTFVSLEDEYIIEYRAQLRTDDWAHNGTPEPVLAVHMPLVWENVIDAKVAYLRNVNTAFP